eukprot:444399-Hanusia_phi.AAC.1
MRPADVNFGRSKLYKARECLWTTWLLIISGCQSQIVQEEFLNKFNDVFDLFRNTHKSRSARLQAGTV